jgi:hypothetical protein
MGIGVAILLIAAGLILAFAVKAAFTIGIILLAVGVLGLIVAMTIFGPRRGAADGTVVEERRVLR